MTTASPRREPRASGRRRKSRDSPLARAAGSPRIQSNCPTHLGDPVMQKTATFAALMLLALIAAPRAIVQAGDKKADAVTPSPTAENVELPKADANGWISLFGGKDLKGWYGDPKIWRVEPDFISGKAANASPPTFPIYTLPSPNSTLTTT